MAHGESSGSAGHRARRAPGPADGTGPLVPPWARRLLLALLLTAACVLGREAPADPTGRATVWPAAGVAFLWLASSWRDRRALAVDAALVVVLSGAVNALTGVPPAQAGALGLANAAGPLAGCWVFRRTAGEPGWPLTRPLHLRPLLCGAAAAALGTAAVGTAGTLLLAGPGAVRAGPTAALVLRVAVTTSVVAAVGLRLHHARPRPEDLRGWRVLEAAVLLLALGAGYGAVFSTHPDVPVVFALLPLSVWAGARFGATSTALHALAVGAVVLGATLVGSGPFAAGYSLARFLLAHALVAVVLLVSLPLALEREERQRLIDSLHRAREDAAAQAALLEAVVTSTREGIAVVDARGRVVLRNPRAEELLGREVLRGGTRRTSSEYGISRPDGTPLPEAESPLGRALRGEDVPETDVLLRRPDLPEARVLSVSARPLPGPPGERGAVAAMRDVTAERAAAAQVAEARDLFGGVLAAATDQAIVATDRSGRITLFNEGAHRMLGYTAAQVLGSLPTLWHDPEEVRRRAAELGVEPGPAVLVQEAVQGRAGTRSWTFLARDGRRLQVRQTVTAMRDGDGAVRGFIAIAVDVTERQRAERALAASEQRFRRAFEAAPVGMALVSTAAGEAGRLVRVNDALCAFTGRTAGDLVGRRLQELAGDGGPEPLEALLARLAAGEVEDVRTERRFSRPDGSAVWGSCSASAAGGAQPGDAVLIVEDVTARRDAEAALTRRALHDALTGLPNRALLADRLEHALVETGRSGLRAGLVYLDLDGFKEVNDTAGHAAGDELLVQVAQRLLHCVRPGDTVTRLGGDEFAVVCPGIGGAADLHAVAARALEVVRRPYELDAGAFSVSASVGATLAGAGDTPERVLRAADEAMYAAKRAGKDRVVLRDAELPGAPVTSSRLLRDLRRGLDEGELVLHGQPVVDLVTGAVTGVEVLVRWHHPERGLLLPVEFLDAAAASSLVHDLSVRVLGEACRMAAVWGELLGAAAPSVHVNVSAREVESGRLGADVAEALQRYHLPGHRLVLEVAEPLVPLLRDALARDVGRLREAGVRLAVDDLGTGSSSLARLSELPVDLLKVDGRIVAGLGAEPASDAVVRAVVGVGRALGPTVVAEGVQTPVQADRLRRYGCDLAQGHLFSPPRPEGELLQLLREWSGRGGAAEVDLRDGSRSAPPAPGA